MKAFKYSLLCSIILFIICSLVGMLMNIGESLIIFINEHTIANLVFRYSVSSVAFLSAIIFDGLILWIYKITNNKAYKISSLVFIIARLVGYTLLVVFGSGQTDVFSLLSQIFSGGEPLQIVRAIILLVLVSVAFIISIIEFIIVLKTNNTEEYKLSKKDKVKYVSFIILLITGIATSISNALFIGILAIDISIFVFVSATIVVELFENFGIKLKNSVDIVIYIIASIIGLVSIIFIMSFFSPVAFGIVPAIVLFAIIRLIAFSSFIVLLVFRFKNN